MLEQLPTSRAWNEQSCIRRACAQWESMTAAGHMNTYNNGYNDSNMLFGANSSASSGYPIHEDIDGRPLAHENLEVRFATDEELQSIVEHSILAIPVHWSWSWRDHSRWGRRKAPSMKESSLP